MSDATHVPDDDASALRLVGQALRDGREQRELNQHELANRLHIGVEQLVALETGRMDGLPEPVFVKAMVRRIASYLQIDPDPLVAQLQRPKGSGGPPSRDTAAEDTQASPKTQSTTTTTTNNTLPLLLWLLPIVLLGAAGALWGLNRTSQRPLTASAPPVSPVREAMPPQASVPPSTTPVLQISSLEPSWITIRRNGEVEFEGLLEQPKVIDDPHEVEVYAGRPDLVMVDKAGEPGTPLGPITPLQWYSLSPEPSR